VLLLCLAHVHVFPKRSYHISKKIWHQNTLRPLPIPPPNPLFHFSTLLVFPPKFDANLLNTEKTLITSKCELFLQPEADPGLSIVGHRALCLFPVLDLLP